MRKSEESGAVFISGDCHSAQGLLRATSSENWFSSRAVQAGSKSSKEAGREARLRAGANEKFNVLSCRGEALRAAAEKVRSGLFGKTSVATTYKFGVTKLARIPHRIPPVTTKKKYKSFFMRHQYCDAKQCVRASRHTPNRRDFFQSS